MKEEDYISFVANEASNLPVTSVLVPRPTAWMVVYPSDDDKRYDGTNTSQRERKPLLTLVEGYGGGSDRPPTLVIGSDSISASVLSGLRANKVCSLSVATERDAAAVSKIVADTDNNTGNSNEEGDWSGRIAASMTFEEMGLKPCDPPLAILDDLPKGAAASSVTCGKYCFKRPPAVDSSPVQMHCRLAMEVPLRNDDDTKDNPSSTPSTMILLQIDTYIIKGNTLRTQSTLYPGKSTVQGNPDVRSITAKIDCLLLRPLGSLGNGRFGRVTTIHHMGRPRPKVTTATDNDDGSDNSQREAKRKKRELSQSQQLINSCRPNQLPSANIMLDETTCSNVDWQSNSMWEIDDLIPSTSIALEYDNNINFEEGDGQTISYTYREDAVCPLGYNPMKQVVCPRFIGWIATYEPDSLAAVEKKKNNPDVAIESSGDVVAPIAHISPYSFCIDVAHGSRPMLAFAACPRSDEFVNSDYDGNNSHNSERATRNSDSWKDAQRDAELTGVFCVNLVSQSLAWAMNASAEPLGKGLSEFKLMEDCGCGEDSSATATETTTTTSRITPTPVKAPQIQAPHVAESPIFMECRYFKTVKIPDIHENDSMYSLIIGEVISIHVRKDVVAKHHVGKGLELDLARLRPVARLGYGQEYTVVTASL